MGVTPGVEIRRLGAAPLGDPLEFELRGYRLSLRKSEAQQIEIDRTLPIEDFTTETQRARRQAVMKGLTGSTDHFPQSSDLSILQCNLLCGLRVSVVNICHVHRRPPRRSALP